MLSASQLVTRKETLTPALPGIDGFRPLYDREGVVLREGQHIMIVGRPGSQKSGVALWMTAQMGLETLYFAGDMSPGDTSRRILKMEHGLPFRECPERSSFSHLKFVFGTPLRWESVATALNAHVMLWGRYPKVIVLDNLQDFAGAVSAYEAQMEVSAGVSALCRATGITAIVLHHATNKTRNAEMSPEIPPSQADVKNNLSEKPELMIGVALDPNPLGNTNLHALNFAVLKNREGSADPSGGRTYSAYINPALSRIYPNERQAVDNVTKWDTPENIGDRPLFDLNGSVA